MTGAQPKGWCPGVWRPMAVEDGLLVRLRPHLGRLTVAQVLGLCEVAETCGNGLIEVTTRANLQLRGVSETSHSGLLRAFDDLGLLDPDPDREVRRSIAVAPDWTEGDDTFRATTVLTERLDELPAMPAKFGFVVDLGRRPCLADVSGDIRLERGLNGWLLRADGIALGRRVQESGFMEPVIEMCDWFLTHQSPDRRRMAEVVAVHDLPQAWQEAAPLASERPANICPLPVKPFPADTLRNLVTQGTREIRLTPWRGVLLRDKAQVEDVPNLQAV